MLQQYLPFTVLKHHHLSSQRYWFHPLQQYLPFTVLKPDTVDDTEEPNLDSCNSTYRLRY